SCPTVVFCLAAGGQGTVLASLDGGRSWTLGSTGMPAVIYDGVPAVESVSCPAPTFCLAVASETTTSAARLLRSTDGGRTWSLTALGVITHGTAIAVTCATPQACVIVGRPYQVVTTTDGGTTWNPPLNFAFMGETLYDVACADPTLCVAVGGTILAGGIADA